jgi:eukaryotic-like serine/threonine-protein kinase
LSDERSETISSTEQIESIALETLTAPQAILPRPTCDPNEIDVQVALGEHPYIALDCEAEVTEGSQSPGPETQTGSQRIDDYCDSQRLNIPARLRLFIQVCEAVHFAHQRAIIHGALRPSNIVVTANGAPRLRGFGISSIACPEAATRNENVPPGGTSNSPTSPDEAGVSLECASPEQLKGERITTVSDLYSLGVILYQLLTGHSPYRFLSSARSDVISAVFEQATEKPSSAVSRYRNEPALSAAGLQPAFATLRLPGQLHEPLAHPAPSPPFSTPQEIAQARGSSPNRLKRILTGDLDAIVLTALRMEPQRRYVSAQHLADDLNRYLQGKPVRALGDSTVYFCQKFLHRNRMLVMIAVLVIATMLTTVIALTSGLDMARHQRDRAEQSLTHTREIVDQLFARMTNQPLLGQPGLVPLRTALLEDAQRFYRSYLDLNGSVGVLDPELITARSQLARIARLIGSTAEAESQYRQVAALWEQVALEQPTNRRYQERLAATLSDLGEVLMVCKDRLEEADHTLHRALELIEPLMAAEPESVWARQELGRVLFNLGQIRSRRNDADRALEFLERALEINWQLASESPGSLEPTITLASIYATMGQILAAQASGSYEAIACRQKASEIYQTIVQNHPELADQAFELARNLDELSGLQQRVGQFDLAFQSLQQSLNTFTRLDQLHPRVLIYERGLGSAYNRMADLERKRAETTESLAVAQKAQVLFERLVAEHPLDLNLRSELAKTYNNLAHQCQQTGQRDKALRSFQRAIDLYESLPDLSAQTAYQLACNISGCISLIGTYNLPTAGGRAVPQLSKSDQLRQQVYADRAMAVLRRAARGGCLTAESLETERDLEPLHNRADFQDLIKELERKRPETSN